MTHLKLEQSISNREIVSSGVIQKLYELVSSGTLDNTSHLQGWLYVPLTYRLYVETITDDSSDITKDLTVEYGDYAIPFADPAVKTAVIAALNLSSDGVTETQAANAQFTSSSFADNTDITTFNEFDLFTRANDNPPTYLFKGCTNLSEINLSNATYFSDREFNVSGIEDLYAPRLNTINGTRQFKGSGVKTIRSLGNITNIPALMFSHCGNLQSIVLPETLVEIGNEAFSWYGAHEDALYTTKEYDTVTITGLNNVTIIGNRAFYGCNNFQIPIADLSNLQSIGTSAFWGCAKLTGELNCPNITTLSNGSFTSSGINKIKCLGKINSIPTGLINKDQNSSSALKTALTEVYLPYECTTIGVAAFEWNTALTTIKQYTDSVDNWTVDQQTGEKIPSSYGDISRVTNIGNSAFKRTGLTSIYLENVTTLGTSVFENAESLAIQNLSMPNLTSIGNACFKNTSIQQVSNLGSITSVPQECFNGCTSLTSVVIPSTCTQIYSSAFLNCSSLSSIDIDVSKLTSIGNSAFQNAGTALSGALTFSECLSIGQNAFYNCHNITELHFPKLTDVNQYNLWNSMDNLEVLDLPVATRLNTCVSLPKLTTINAPSATVFGSYGDLRLTGCPLLTTVNINFSAVTTIGGYAFQNDSGLAGQYFEFPNVTMVSQTSFNSCGINFIFSNNSVVQSAADGVVFQVYTGTIYVPDALLSDYQADSFWSRLGSNQLKGMSQLPANYNS